MGTNYYLTCNVCPKCGRADELHIGKSSYGWHFSLHVIPDRNINSLDDWKKLFTDGIILDEYQRLITTEEMIDIITNRVAKNKYQDSARWYRENHAEPGLNKLARHIVDGRHCIGHGEGTWDYITGEFS